MARRQKIRIKERVLDIEKHPNPLKYYRTVAYFIKRQYSLSQADLDMLIFIYDIPLFTRTKFNEFKKMVPWDVNRFERLKREGWIIVYRKAGINKHALYRISQKGRRMITEMYKRLEGRMPFPEHAYRNNCAESDKSTDIVFYNIMMRINQEIRDEALRVVWVKDEDA